MFPFVQISAKTFRKKAICFTGFNAKCKIRIIASNLIQSIWKKNDLRENRIAICEIRGVV